MRISDVGAYNFALGQSAMVVPSQILHASDCVRPRVVMPLEDNKWANRVWHQVGILDRIKKDMRMIRSGITI